MKRFGLRVSAIAATIALTMLQAGAIPGYDATCSLTTSGQAGTSGGNIYINPDSLTFNYNELGQNVSGLTVKLHYSPVDGGGNWTNTQTITLSLEEYNGGSFTAVRGSTGLLSLSITQRYEFVIEHIHNGTTTWLKPFEHNVSSNAALYNLAPDSLHGSSGTYNGFFYPIETPYAVIDYPTENENIGSSYTIRLGSNPSTNNMRVKIDSGDWSQCYYSAGYWWFDWANYGMGDHTIVVEGWNAIGQRTESSVRNCSRTS